MYSNKLYTKCSPLKKKGGGGPSALWPFLKCRENSNADERIAQGETAGA